MIVTILSTTVINLKNENKNNIIQINEITNQVSDLKNDITEQANLIESKDKEIKKINDELLEKQSVIDIQMIEINDLKKKLASKIERDKEVQQHTLSRGGSVGKFLGQFKISFYTPYDGSTTGITASGNKAIPKYTVAVDPNIIPLGTKLYIEGLGEAVAQDTGGAIKGNILDYCVSSKAEAMKLGIKYLKVWIIN